MSSIDKYHGRIYDRKRFNCYHFANEVWTDLTGDPLVFFNGAGLTRDFVTQFEELQSAVSPCIVVMQRQRTVPHIGIFIRGSVLHLTKAGVEYQPLCVAMRGFTEVRFAVCKS